MRQNLRDVVDRIFVVDMRLKRRTSLLQLSPLKLSVPTRFIKKGLCIKSTNADDTIIFDEAETNALFYQLSRVP